MTARTKIWRAAAITAAATAGVAASLFAAGPANADDAMQQVAMPASGSCADEQSSSLNWAGVSPGGWTASWAQWANQGKGGAVCVRWLTTAANGTWYVSGQPPWNFNILQAVGLPQNGNCATVFDAAANLSGVPPQGWEPSWGQWANQGKGGAVCVRWLGFDDRSRAWYVL